MAKRDTTHARDDRSEEEWAGYMSEADKKEEIWADIICNEMCFQSRKKITYENYGCGHDGKIITKAEDVNAKPDKKFIVDGKEILIEIKAYDRSNGNPRKMMTIKTHSLKECVKYNAFIVVPSVEVWAILPPASLEYVLGYGESKIYKGFSPNDPAIRMTSMDIGIMLDAKAISIRPWEDWESTNRIKKNWKKLFIKEE